jgi:hypothetical protein
METNLVKKIHACEHQAILLCMERYESCKLSSEKFGISDQNLVNIFSP